jgi:hypothetical protein
MLQIQVIKVVLDATRENTDTQIEINYSVI